MFQDLMKTKNWEMDWQFDWLGKHLVSVELLDKNILIVSINFKNIYEEPSFKSSNS